MSPAQAIKTGIAKSFQFKGSASRTEFWWFAAFVVLLGVIAAGLDWSLFTAKAYSGADRELIMLRSNHEVARLIGLLVLIPLAAVCVRRLANVKHSAFWVVPPVLISLFLVMMVWSGQSISAREVIDLRQSQNGTVSAGQLGFFLCFFALLLPIIFPIWLYLKPTKPI